MPVRKADVMWQGSIQDGKGTMKLGSGAFEGQFSFSTRFEEGAGTNPEELIGAALAGCYSMALSKVLGQSGYEPKNISTTARVHLDKAEGGFTISKIELHTEGGVDGISESEFIEKAQGPAKENCIVRRALGSVDVEVHAKLV
ncbi:MAG: OsmC family peroxiredoxin [Chloroflexota bacterium]